MQILLRGYIIYFPNREEEKGEKERSWGGREGWQKQKYHQM